MPRQAMERRRDALHERAYRMLSGDDSDERACRAIPEESCTAVPANYLLNVANGAATKLAEQIASPGLVLPWLMTAIGAPGVFATLFVPVKQVGSLLPQLAIAGRIRAVSRRKWVWAGAGATQAIMLALLAAAVVALPPAIAAAVAVGLFALFCIASGAGSVAFQDVVGKTIPKGARGRMLANRALTGGILALTAGLALRLVGDIQGQSVELVLLLVLTAAALWALAALLFAMMHEEAGATEGGRSILTELRGGFALARAAGGFRRYLVARALLLAVELAMPVFVLQANAHGATATADLPVYVLAVAASAIVSSPFWGHFADRTSETVLALSGIVGAIAGAGMIAVPLLSPVLTSAWSLAPFFALLGIAEAGVRLGRKTYLVDGAPTTERPLYTAFSNTVIGVLAFSGFAFGIMADLLSPAAAIATIAVLAIGGTIAAAALPPAERMAEV